MPETTYGRERTTAWLGWLAHNLRRHGESLFLVEHLQPSWLGRRWQKVLNELSWSTVFGVSIGLIFSGFWWVSDVVEGDAVNVGLGWWLLITPLWVLAVGGLDRLHRRLWRESLWLRRRPTLPESFWSTASYWLTWSLLWLAASLVLKAGVGWLEQPLFAGAAFAVVYQARIGAHNLTGRIRPVERLGWSWRHAFAGAAWGFGIALVLWLLYFGALTLFENLKVDNVARLWRIYLPAGTVFGALFRGFQMKVLERRTVPNQGIWQSLRNGLVAALVFLPALSLTLCGGLLARGYNAAESAFAAVVDGLLSAAIAFLWYGGLDFIRHFVLRLFLLFDVPRDLARFLDWAAAGPRFLDKVGGGYVFRHRYLLEHFEKPDVAPLVLPEPPPTVEEKVSVEPAVEEPAVEDVDSTAFVSEFVLEDLVPDPDPRSLLMTEERLRKMVALLVVDPNNLKKEKRLAQFVAQLVLDPEKHQVFARDKDAREELIKNAPLSDSQKDVLREGTLAEICHEVIVEGERPVGSEKVGGTGTGGGSGSGG